MRLPLAFEVVDAEEAERVKALPRRGAPLSPASEALLAGEVLFLPGQRQSQGPAHFDGLRSRGYRIRTRARRDGIAGVYVWAEKAEP